MRIVMTATGDIAIPTFQALEKTGELVGLVTQPDRPVGRHMVLTSPRIKVCAEEVGIPVMHVVKKLDAGDIICRSVIPLKGRETAESLHDDLAQLAPAVVMEAIEELRNGTAERVEQDENLMDLRP